MKRKILGLLCFVPICSVIGCAVYQYPEIGYVLVGAVAIAVSVVAGVELLIE